MGADQQQTGLFQIAAEPRQVWSLFLSLVISKNCLKPLQIVSKFVNISVVYNKMLGWAPQKVASASCPQILGQTEKACWGKYFCLFGLFISEGKAYNIVTRSLEWNSSTIASAIGANLQIMPNFSARLGKGAGTRGELFNFAYICVRMLGGGIYKWYVQR